MSDRALDTIKEKKVTVRLLKSRLINLNVRNKEQHKDFLDANIFSEADTESTVEDVWRKLSGYSNFLNYTLTEHLIKKFGGQDLLETMKAYRAKLEVFCSKTRLCDFVQYFKGMIKCKDTLIKNLKVKFDQNWKTCTLQDMEGWKKSLTQELLLPSFTVNPSEIGTGCVSITWAIPAIFTPSLVEKLEAGDMTAFCDEHKIMSLTFDGVEYLGAPVMEESHTLASTHKYTGQYTFYILCTGLQIYTPISFFRSIHTCCHSSPTSCYVDCNSVQPHPGIPAHPTRTIHSSPTSCYVNCNSVQPHPEIPAQPTRTVHKA